MAPVSYTHLDVYKRQNKDCAWEKIYQRLAKQGRLEEFLNQPVQVRDFSKVNFKVINDYVKSIREDRLNGYYGGVHPSEHKEFSEHVDLKKFPDPKTVVISMSQHLGAPANPIVQVGDTVKVGQKIGEAAGFISAPVHSSVSGTVVAVEPRMHGTRGSEVMAVVIESDGKNTLQMCIRDRYHTPEHTSYESCYLTYQPMPVKVENEMLGTIRQHAKWFANGAATKKMYLTVSHTEDGGMNFSYHYQTAHLEEHDMELLYYYMTVSYTHLDVYKRQG